MPLSRSVARDRFPPALRCPEGYGICILTLLSARPGRAVWSSPRGRCDRALFQAPRPPHAEVCEARVRTCTSSSTVALRGWRSTSGSAKI